MNVEVNSRPTVQPAATSKLAIADGDIHPQRNAYKDLFPYMEQRWVDMAKTFGSRPRQAYQAGPAYRRASRTRRAGMPGRPRVAGLAAACRSCRSSCWTKIISSSAS